MKIKLTWSNIANTFVVVLIIIFIVNPQAKGLLLQGLMKVGLFKAPAANTVNTDTNRQGTPNLRFVDTEGRTVNTHDHAGKVIFINLWATWCPPCIAEMPSINEMYSRYANRADVLILTVDVDNDFDKATEFLNRKGYRLPLYQLAGYLPPYLYSGSIPTTIIIDKNGAVATLHQGAANYADNRFYTYMDQLISQ